MSPYHKKQKVKKRKNLYRKWHRRIGFTAAIFLINLAVTGILLNHSEDLELHNNFVESPWLTDWYGVVAPEQALCFSLQSKRIPICQLGEKIFSNEQLLIQEANQLVSAVDFEGLIYLATLDQVYVYTESLELVEVISAEEGLPTPILSFGISEKLNHPTKKYQSRFVSIVSQNSYWIMEPDELYWKETVSFMLTETSLFRLNEESLLQLQTLYSKFQLTQLKLVQDLHSGRILSFSGQLITDLVGVVIILLVLSGFLAWQKRNKTPTS